MAGLHVSYCRTVGIGGVACAHRTPVEADEQDQRREVDDQTGDSCLPCRACVLRRGLRCTGTGRRGAGRDRRAGHRSRRHPAGRSPLRRARAGRRAHREAGRRLRLHRGPGLGPRAIAAAVLRRARERRLPVVRGRRGEPLHRARVRGRSDRPAVGQLQRADAGRRGPPRHVRARQSAHLAGGGGRHADDAGGQLRGPPAEQSERRRLLVGRLVVLHRSGLGPRRAATSRRCASTTSTASTALARTASWSCCTAISRVPTASRCRRTSRSSTWRTRTRSRRSGWPTT